MTRQVVTITSEQPSERTGMGNGYQEDNRFWGMLGERQMVSSLQMRWLEEPSYWLLLRRLGRYDMMGIQRTWKTYCYNIMTIWRFDNQLLILKIYPFQGWGGSCCCRGLRDRKWLWYNPELPFHTGTILIFSKILWQSKIKKNKWNLGGTQKHYDTAGK